MHHKFINLTPSHWFVLLFAARALRALSVDTTIVADGSPGPYRLGSLFVNSATLYIAFKDSAKGPVPPYTYVDDVNGVLFSESIDSGCVLDVRYTTSFYGLTKTYALYERATIDTTDTALAATLRASARRRDFLTEGNLEVSGYKSVGVSVGNLGQMNLEQGLEVHITGQIAPQTEVSANLSDQATSLEGDTREIGELDMVYIALKNPHYNAVVGDQYVSWLPGGILSQRKKIKGLSAGASSSWFSGQAFGAISGGSFAVQTMAGRQGFQGPYYLTGNGEPDLITPVSGTVKVTVDGKDLREGEDADYVVDYQQGTLRFTPRLPIADNQVIRAEYEYKTFNYQRLFFGADISAASPDSTVKTRGMLWYETDDKNQPIDLQLTDAVKDSMINAGDNLPPFTTARQVNPNDVASQSQVYPLYRMTYDTVAAESIYVYTPYDPNNPTDNQGFYYLWFRNVGQGSGDYAIDSTDYRGNRYRFVGKGQGDYTPTAPVPAPQRTVQGEILTALTPRPWLNLTFDVAGESQNKNLFSNRTDLDVNSAATRSGLLLGRRSLDSRSAWFDATHTYVSRRFPQEVISYYERKVHWGQEHDTITTGEQHVWETSAGTALAPGVSTEFSYGQYIRDGVLLTQRGSNQSNLRIGDDLKLTYAGDVLLETDRVDMPLQHHDKIGAELDYSAMRYGLTLDDERKSSGDTVRGSVGAGANLTVKPLNLDEAVYFARQRLGLHWLAGATDTGTYFTWTQDFNHSLRKGWTLSGTSSYQRRELLGSVLTTTLVTAQDNVNAPRLGLSTHQEYSVSSEQASTIVQMPVFAGQGQGTYSLDSTTKQLTPNQFGSYLVQDQEVYDQTSDRRVRKTSLAGDWTFRPPASSIKGVLADVTWNGSFGVQENLTGDSGLTLKSWVPGYYSLAVGDTVLSYANLFYRQGADWRPQVWEKFHVGVHVRPAYRLQTGLSEHELEWGANVDKQWTKWKAELEGRVLDVRQQGAVAVAGGKDTIADQYVNLEERYELVRSWFLFVKEGAGRAARDRTLRPWGPYWRVQPGVTFTPLNRGTAEASYAVSWVNVDGTMDYRMAQGYASGLSHVVAVMADIRVGNHFSVGGTYRGEFTKPLGAQSYNRPLLVLSMEMKAFL